MTVTKYVREDLLAAANERIRLLEHDAKSGNYETLYAQTVHELAAEREVSGKLEAALNSFEISAPDGDGVLWLKIRAKDTSASGMFRIGKVGLIVAQVALHIRADMSTALAEVAAIRTSPAYIRETGLAFFDDTLITKIFVEGKHK